MVAVVGPADADESHLALAEEVGRLLGDRGVVVVTGGLGGVMAAACRGARGVGATTLGFLPGADRGEANEWVSQPIPTGLGQGRNVLVALSADVVIAVGGSWGTLSEVAHARRAGRPVVTVSGWQVLDATGMPMPDLVAADDAESAVAAAMAAISGSGVKGGDPSAADSIDHSTSSREGRREDRGS